MLQGSDRRYEFFEANLGLSALNLIRDNEKTPFDCMLLEYHTPDMDAQEVLVSICNGREIPPCPVVAITGSDRKAGPALLRAGAHGSEFIVRLPIVLSRPNSPEVPMIDEEVKGTRPLRVLVVDDNVDTVLSFSMLLKASGHDVCKAHDGLAAVQAASDYRPDVVLLDIGLPGLNGYEVAKRIRQIPILKDIVLVALTDYGQDTDRQLSAHAGFNHHLVKPARLEQLQKILGEAALKIKGAAT